MNENREFTPLTENRLKHMNAVANRAYTLAKIMFSKTEYIARKMYIYGLLHDVGYVFDPTRYFCYRQLFYTDEEVAKVRKEYEDALNNMTNLISSK